MHPQSTDTSTPSSTPLSQDMPARFERPCAQCGKVMIVERWRELRSPVKYCSQACYGISIRGANHVRSNGGRVVDQDGYIYWRINGRGLIAEHRLVMEQHVGRRLRSDEHVHHVNEQPGDNRLENLRILSPGEHSTLHNRVKPMRWSRDYDACIICGTTERPYTAHGLCQTCYPRHRKATDKWSPDHDACVVCGSPERRHRAHGRCTRCYSREYARTHYVKR